MKKSNIIGGERWILANLDKFYYAINPFKIFCKKSYYRYQLKLAINNILKE